MIGTTPISRAACRATFTVSVTTAPCSPRGRKLGGTLLPTAAAPPPAGRVIAMTGGLVDMASSSSGAEQRVHVEQRRFELAILPRVVLAVVTLDALDLVLGTQHHR